MNAIATRHWPLEHAPAVRIAIVAERPSATNDRLACTGGDAWSWLTPAAALDLLVPGDVGIGLLDVLPTLDGIDGGLRVLGSSRPAVCACSTRQARCSPRTTSSSPRACSKARSLPHPRTSFVSSLVAPPYVAGPCVVKPRFGSWGRAVFRCDDAVALERLLSRLASERWFAVHGALVQELIEPAGRDLRLVVAGGRVVGAISRVAAAGEWRTNVSLGATRRPVSPPCETVELALAAADAVRADLVGVDLLPDGDGWTIVELNGAVEFTGAYSLGSDVDTETVRELELRALLGDLGAPRPSPAPL